MKILCIGPIWRGSNAGGLFKALGRNGCLIEVVDEFYYLSLLGESKAEKLLYKAIRPMQIKAFNHAILAQANLFEPDVVLVYKGHFVTPDTLTALKVKYPIVNFYPDVSFHTHGSLLQKTLPMYRLVFTTKTFGIADMARQLGQQNGVFIPHGYDPEIHRPIEVKGNLKEQLSADISFIGTWSARKEKYLTALAEGLPQATLKIWGSQWHKAGRQLLPYIQGKPVLGDLYAATICCTKINLGLLSEQVRGASSGDLITSRTFHIPGTGGFMLHQNNQEANQYFEAGMEADFFSDETELLIKVKHYLDNEEQRLAISKTGQQRAKAEYSLDHRAAVVQQKMETIL